MPHTMRRLVPVQFFSWLALFAMWIYTTPAVTQVHFHSTDPASAAYNEGANWVGVMFGAYNGFAAVAAVIIPFMVRRYGLRRSHMVNVWLGGAGFLSIAFIRDPNWLLLSMLGVGIAWASILSIPYALLSDSVPAEKMGVYMGIFNFFIVIPQLVAARCAGVSAQDSLFGGAPVRALTLGGVCFLIAGLLAGCPNREIRPTGFPDNQPGRQHDALGVLLADQAQQGIDQDFAGAAGVLHDRGERRVGEAGRGNIVEADHRDLGGHFDLTLLQRAHGTHSDQVAGGDDGIELHAARQEFVGGLKAGLLGADRVDLRGRINCEAHRRDRLGVPAVALHEFRVVIGAIAKEGEPAAAQAEQVTRRIVAAAKIIAADRQPGLAGQHRTPAHEMRAVLDEFLEAREVGQVIAVAEQDDAVRLATVFVVLVPVARHLLEGNQQVIAPLGAGPGY
jgi:hypothetical protein